jgi:hypothetical protein
MPLIPTIDSSKLREAAARVKEIDPDLRKNLIRNLKSDLLPYAQRIAGGVPTLGVPKKVRGFRHGGRTSWSPVKSSVYVNPGGGKGSVARIEIYSSPNKAAFKIADLAGTRQNYNDGNFARLGGQPFYMIMGQGQDLVTALTDVQTLSANGKGGRFAWRGFIKHRPFFVGLIVKRLDDYGQKISERIGR